MQAAEVFVLPTYTEGFPNVILEAMAAGKAIVSTRVGAIAEMLDADGESPSGLVIQPRDAGSLANALRQLLSDAELRETLGARARGKVTRCYSTDVVFRRLLDLWDAPERQPIIAGVQSCSLALK
ncbi:MAG: glycosyltransferase family 4 protein [Verrucomicrobiota bacterium]